MFDHIPLTLAQQDPSPGGAGGGQGGAEGTTTEQPAPGQAEDGQGQAPGGPGLEGLLLPLLLLVLLIVFIWLPQRRERKRMEEVQSSLKKNVRVQTRGGIIGTVAEVRDHEVLLKIDENTNTRLRLARSAILSVIPEEGAPEQQ